MVSETVSTDIERFRKGPIGDRNVSKLFQNLIYLLTAQNRLHGHPATKYFRSRFERNPNSFQSDFIGDRNVAKRLHKRFPWQLVLIATGGV